jgi:hypothetical protein
MSIKIEIINNALVCTDTVSSEILISQPSKDIWYKERDLITGRISLYKTNIDADRGADIELPYITLSDAVNSALAAFTVLSFRTFMYTK